MLISKLKCSKQNKNYTYLEQNICMFFLNQVNISFSQIICHFFLSKMFFFLLFCYYLLSSGFAIEHRYLLLLLICEFVPTGQPLGFTLSHYSLLPLTTTVLHPTSVRLNLRTFIWARLCSRLFSLSGKSFLIQCSAHQSTFSQVMKFTCFYLLNNNLQSLWFSLLEIVQKWIPWTFKMFCLLNSPTST